MRVLFIHNQYLQKGGEDVTASLEAEILKQKGHQVRMIFFQNVRPSGIHKITGAAKAIYNSSSYRHVSEEIELFKPDVIHIHNLFFQASPSVLFAAYRNKIPVVFTLQNYRLICCNALLLRDGKPCELCVQKTFPLYGIKYKCYHNSITQSTMVTAISASHKIIGTWRHKVSRFILPSNFGKSRFVNSSLNVPEEKLMVKPNFIPDPGKSTAEREDFFLFAGRLAREKGIHIAAEAFSQIPGQRLVVIGDGPERLSVESKFSHCPNIILKGSLEREEVMWYMKRCKALIFPSTWYEGLPFVVLEALANGTPVIISALGSMLEMVENGYNGFHFEPGNANDLQEKIHLFLQTGKNERGSLYENARATYLNKFHPDIHYKTILSIYETVIAERGSAGG